MVSYLRGKRHGGALACKADGWLDVLELTSQDGDEYIRVYVVRTSPRRTDAPTVFSISLISRQVKTAPIPSFPQRGAQRRDYLDKRQKPQN